MSAQQARQGTNNGLRARGPSGTGGKTFNSRGVADAYGAIFTEVLIMRHHAFAAAIGIATAALLAPSSQSLAASADPTGYWMKPDAERESKIQVFKCGTGKKLLCAKIAWLKDPSDTRGQPLHDIRNEDPSKRARGIVGLAIFTGLAPSAPSTWTGQIYNPEDGHTYSATLTVLSRKQILLRGCKAWLLCGEKQWLRTSAPPEELKPAAPAEGAEQIEASAEPAIPPSVPDAKPEAAVAEAAAPEATPAAPAPQAEMQAMAAPQAPAKPQEAAVIATPVSLVTQEVAAPVAAPAEVNTRRGYGFLNVSTSPDTAARLSGENVSSMFVMTKPIAAEAVTPESTDKSTTTAAIQSDEIAPAPKPKPKPIATAAAQPAPKTATAPKPASQAAPAPHDAAQADLDTADAPPPGATAEAAMVEEPAPLTRRQRRLLRKQQEQEGQFLPWLR
jgi:uncharacterized protein (DUF2147 family)